MNILSIFDNTVEFSFFNDNEIQYLSTENFILKFGKTELFGNDIKIIESAQGTLYVC